MQDKKHPAIVMQSHNGTSNLLNHARAYHGNTFETLIKASNAGKSVQKEFDGLLAAMSLQSARSNSKAALTGHGFSVIKREHAKIEKEVAMLACLVSNNLPFHLLDSQQFVDWMATLDAVYPSRASIMKLLPVLYDIAAGHYEQLIRDCGVVTLTFDLWTSLAQSKYLVVTYEFMDAAFVRHSVPLDLVRVAGGAYGEAIASLIKARLVQHKLDDVLVASTVSDSGSNCVNVKELLTAGDDEPCFLHNLDHVVKDVLSNAALSIGRDFSALVSVIGAIRGSPQLRDAMAQRAGDDTSLELILPSETRWLDYYRALERALVLRTALQAMREEGMLDCAGVTPDFLLEDFWTRMTAFVTVLKKFYLTSRNAQSLTKPTLSCVPRWISDLRSSCVRKETDSPVTAELKSALLVGIEARLTVFVSVTQDVMPNAIKAALLDPRQSRWMQQELTQVDVEAAVQAIVADTVLLFGDDGDALIELMGKSMQGGGPTVLKAVRLADLRADDDALQWWLTYAATADTKGTGLLTPWCRAARMFLAMPAGSSPSEFAFSATTNIVTKKRTLLADETLEMTMVLHHYVKSRAYDLKKVVAEVLRRGGAEEEPDDA